MCNESLSNMRRNPQRFVNWKHLALYAYKSPAQRFEPPPEQQTKRQNNKARPTRVDGYHGTSRKAPDQKFEQRVNYVARSEPPRPISPQLSETSSNAGSFYGKMLSLPMAMVNKMDRTANTSANQPALFPPQLSTMLLALRRILPCQPLARKSEPDQRNTVDSLNGDQDVNLIREAQLNAYNINARLQDLSPEQQELYLKTFSKNLLREDKQDDFSEEAIGEGSG
ncbi:unnamed protein product, partial [Mesorhabditis belari]|uniref:Uncharacterized protein n=1 Tax=Mesorhabditis belari TaxID=2138241 RepID=A0AAF3JC59_9BILA